MQLNARSDGPDRKANIEAPQRIRVDLEGFEFDFFFFACPDLRGAANAAVRLDFRPMHSYTLSNGVEYIPPKARVY